MASCGAACAPVDMAGCGAACAPVDMAQSSMDLGCVSASCGGAVDTCSDAHNCGACGHDCQGGACVSGVCQPATFASVQAQPWDLTLDATNLYWTDLATNNMDGTVQSLAKTNLAGAPSPIASMQWSPRKIVVDAMGLYWVDFSAGQVWAQQPLGSGTPAALESSPAMVVDFCVDDTNVYYIENQGPVVRYTPLVNGAGARDILTPLQANQMPSAVACDGSFVYWVNLFDLTLQKTQVPPNNAAPTQLATMLSDPGSLIVFNGFVWFNTGSGISKVSTSGGSVMPVVTGQIANRFAVDADGVYWTDQQGGGVYRMKFSDGVVRTIASAQPVPLGIATDATTIYWVNQGTAAGTGAILRVAK